MKRWRIPATLAAVLLWQPGKAMARTTFPFTDAPPVQPPGPNEGGAYGAVR